MKTPSAILIVGTLLGAICAPSARAESTTEVVLIGRSDLLAQNAPPPRHVTRIERFVEPSSEALSNPALAALDDPQAPLLAAIPNSLPVLEHLVAPARQSDPERAALENISPETAPFAAEEIPSSMFAVKLRPEAMTPTIVAALLVTMTLVSLRRWIFAAISRLVLGLVVAVNHRGATIVSPTRRRRRRRRGSSRNRGQSINWYFRAPRTSSHGRSRRRWSSSGRPRDYVVTDVVYAAAPVQTAPRYLLTSSVN